MGIELLTGIFGAAFAIPVAWKLLDEFFKSSRSLRDSDKASRITIDNHLNHLTNAITTNTEIMEKILKKDELNRQESKEARRDLRITLEKNTEASTKQVMIGQQVIKTLDRLIDKLEK